MTTPLARRTAPPPCILEPSSSSRRGEAMRANVSGAVSGKRRRGTALFVLSVVAAALPWLAGCMDDSDGGGVNTQDTGDAATSTNPVDDTFGGDVDLGGDAVEVPETAAPDTNIDDIDATSGTRIIEMLDYELV